ncbi:hypothetical protein [Niallia circulans]|uniref:Uncharacterized protein n=1 Tax=Niallia circulans TaxID=1397 RepID=A0A941GEQ7_NIACI|nr:hypothetical protein [Niallia circulans]MCB5236222.1 hypothetical protein [Niallia circulans]
MENEIITPKKHGIISYIALAIGIICVFIVFVTPTRIANIGSLVGDYITFFTGAGILLSIIALLMKTEKKLIPVIALILSSSLFIFWIIFIFLLFTGQIEFAP